MDVAGITSTANVDGGVDVEGGEAGHLAVKTVDDIELSGEVMKTSPTPAIRGISVALPFDVIAVCYYAWCVHRWICDVIQLGLLRGESLLLALRCVTADGADTDGG